jgi:hypothetical protein
MANVSVYGKVQSRLLYTRAAAAECLDTVWGIIIRCTVRGLERQPLEVLSAGLVMAV